MIVEVSKAIEFYKNRCMKLSTNNEVFRYTGFF